ncbi:MAG: NAD(P)H-dependent glycerol-3-phosphate dehydrogenase [Gemmatimonadota bacterium]|nr:NAD(P)H-dependent glycerol-3-phosphate dehydrogenase [Gemmatimonadota bacterium]
MRIAVIGAGSWGTTLADLLAGKGEQVTLWAYETGVAEDINSSSRNDLFLPGITLNPELRAGSDLEKVVAGSEVVVTACPSHVMRTLVGRAAGSISKGAVIVNVSKGLETGTLIRMSEVLREVIPAETGARLATLSGPSFALEVAQKLPTVITAASDNEETATFVQKLFSTPFFRVYKHDDVVGVELGGSLKNTVAIATGMIEGAGLGMNTRAALITRGLVEITRLGTSLGARAATFSGVSGLGDLVLTCTGDLSRNRRVGLRIGQGETLEEITRDTRTVAEGIKTTESAHALSLKHGIEMPITGQIYRILFKGHSVQGAIAELMNRELKQEYD